MVIYLHCKKKSWNKKGRLILANKQRKGVAYNRSCILLIVKQGDINLFCVFLSFTFVQYLLELIFVENYFSPTNKLMNYEPASWRMCSYNLIWSLNKEKKETNIQTISLFLSISIQQSHSFFKSKIHFRLFLFLELFFFLVFISIHLPLYFNINFGYKILKLRKKI